MKACKCDAIIPHSFLEFKIWRGMCEVLEERVWEKLACEWLNLERYVWGKMYVWKLSGVAKGKTRLNKIFVMLVIMLVVSDSPHGHYIISDYMRWALCMFVFALIVHLTMMIVSYIHQSTPDEHSMCTWKSYKIFFNLLFILPDS